MTPLVAQMAVFSAIDSTGALSRRGHLRGARARGFRRRNGKLDNVYSGDVEHGRDGCAGRGDAALLCADQRLRRAAAEGRHAGHHARPKRTARCRSPIWPRRGRCIPAKMSRSRRAHRRERRGDRKKTHYRVPVGAPAGPLYLTVPTRRPRICWSFRARSAVHPRVRRAGVWNLERAALQYQRVRARVAGRRPIRWKAAICPTPPPSLALILGRLAAWGGPLANPRGATLAEIEIPAGENIVTGSKTIQIEVKE